MDNLSERPGDGSPSCSATQAPSAAPFSQNIVQLTQAEHIELKHASGYWKHQHAHLKNKYDQLQHELDVAQAKIKDLNHRLYGKKSEKSTAKHEHLPDRQLGSSRPRGQQPGSKGHGRTPLPALPIIDEWHDLPPTDRQCGVCGKAYMPLPTSEDSQIVEVQVSAYVRKVRRKKYAQGCSCEGVPGLVTAPPASRLIPKTSVGISVWVEVLLNKFLFSRATNNLCTDYAYRGLPIAAGTLAGGLKRIAPLFEPLMAAWYDKQMGEDLFHNDETRWKVFEAIEGKIGYRWWLWVTQSPSVVIYQLAPSRSGEVPLAHFSSLKPALEQVIVVCDRYSAYKRLARENPRILLAFCWAHVRRDFLDAAKRWPEHNAWMLSWVERIGELYALNAQRLQHFDNTLALDDQNPAFHSAQQALANALDALIERCEARRKDPELHVSQRDVLNSLSNHWSGLTVFLTHPQVPMDNNTAERRMRNPGMGRKNYYGSGSQWSAALAAAMFSVFQTLLLWKLNPQHWLDAYLNACASNAGQVPTDLSLFIPWQMSEQRRQQLSQPKRVTAPCRVGANAQSP
jgi:transposase